MPATQKVCLIGAGRIAWLFENDKLRYKPCTHVGALTHSREIAARVKWQSICDIDLKRANACVNFIRHKTAQAEPILVEANYEKCLQLYPDILIIATDTWAHAEITEKALRMNIPAIVIEKPVAIAAKEAAKLKKLSEKSASRIFVNYERRYHPKYKNLKKLTADRTYGKVLYYRAFFMAGTKKLHAEGRNEGVLLHDTTHLLDLIMYLFGTPTSFEGSVFSGARANESHNLRLVHENALTGEITTLAGATAFHLELEIVCEKARITIGNGFMTVDEVGKSTAFSNFRVLQHGSYEKDKKMKLSENPFVKLYDAVLTGSSDAHAFRQACQNVQILAAE